VGFHHIGAALVDQLVVLGLERALVVVEHLEPALELLGVDVL